MIDGLPVAWSRVTTESGDPGDANTMTGFQLRKSIFLNEIFSLSNSHLVKLVSALETFTWGRPWV